MKMRASGGRGHHGVGRACVQIANDGVRRDYGSNVREKGARSLCLLSTDAGVGVGDLDTESLGLLEDVDALLGRNVVGNLGSVDTVVHEEELDVTDVGDHEAAVAVGHEVTGLLVGAVTDLGHADGAAETTTHSRVDTLGLAPRFTDTVVSVRVVALEGLGALLNDGDCGSSHLDNLKMEVEWSQRSSAVECQYKVVEKARAVVVRRKSFVIVFDCRLPVL